MKPFTGHGGEDEAVKFSAA